MESWYEVVATDWSVQNEFVLLFAELGRPKGVALFAEYHLDDKMIFFHFSPGAARIAMRLILRYNGIQGIPPAPDRLVLVAGDPSVTADSD